MNHQRVEVLAIGAGPSNLALAVAMEELSPELASRTLIIEQHEDASWQRGMLLPWAQSQVSFLKDLVTLRNPQSRFSFVNYLHSAGRLNEFVNLGSFTPYRSEISDYLLWVAESLSLVRIEYGRRCVRIDPVLRPGGGVEEWTVHLGDGSTVTARTLVVGIGRDPHIPEVFGALPRERIVHSTEYTQQISRFDPAAPHRVAVIGGAQSAAEMLWSTHQGMPRSRCTMIMRSIGLNGYESSKFTNELFYSSFIDEFYGARPEARRQLLAEMHRSNYAGLSPGLLETLYRQTYLERLNGEERLRMITMAEITGARLDGEEIVLTLTDRKTGRRDELACDILLLGTGFDRRMPWLVRDMTVRAGLQEIGVDRVYRLGLPPGSGAACYLQGVNEDTHGIADSLLSVLASRAEEIVGDVRERLAAAELLAPFALPVAS
ncbi:lysine N(6)-hydroxylase/L-ornithine N(5)-oxygenase family protein [Planomonospora corallina]|uniref:L-lysine N6-monooxygenase MbtG n=1 Tax=Planomonospora corallina TaxID=1806052 RepID=A0ABV8IID4_9ACTN